MNDLIEMLTSLAEAPQDDRVICQTIPPRCKELIGKTAGEISVGMTNILNDCAYAGLTSDFMMAAMGHLQQAAQLESIKDGTNVSITLLFEHYPDTAIVTATKHDSGKYAPICHTNDNVLIMDCKPAFDSEDEAITDMHQHIKTVMKYVNEVRAENE